MSEIALSPGLRLKAERERRGLSAQKAADEMHLDRWVIEALEADDYKRIGPTVYAKGHLKKYAALLGVPAAEILAGYETGAASASGAASPVSSILLSARAEAPHESGLSPPQIAACLAAALLVLAVLWWRPWHHRGNVAMSREVAEAGVATAPKKPADSGLVAPASSAPVQGAARDDTPVPAAAVNSESATAAASEEAAVPGAGHARMRLSFSADSWVEIQDAQGKRLFAGNGAANSVKSLAGAGPMRVFLGFGSGVQLEINDRAVAIGPQFFTGDVARFEAGADGVLRRDSRPDARGAQSRNVRPPG